MAVAAHSADKMQLRAPSKCMQSCGTLLHGDCVGSGMSINSGFQYFIFQSGTAISLCANIESLGETQWVGFATLNTNHFRIKGISVLYEHSPRHESLVASEISKQ